MDEALAGHATKVEVILYADQSIEVIDNNGRGMPVDIHPELKVSAIELILAHLHAGGKFSNKTTNTLVACMVSGSQWLMRYQSVLKSPCAEKAKYIKIAFENGDKVEELHQIGTCAKRNEIQEPVFISGRIALTFDIPRFSSKSLSHVLKSQSAVLCPGVNVSFTDKVNNTQETWCYADGLTDLFKWKLSLNLFACLKSHLQGEI